MFTTQKPIAVANYVIDLAKHENAELTNDKLQKVLFGMQGYMLYEYSMPLFNAEFARLTKGPAISELYQLLNNKTVNLTQMIAESYGFDKANLRANVPMMTPKSINDPIIYNRLGLIAKKLLKLQDYKLNNLILNDATWQNYRYMQNVSYYTNHEIRSCYLRNLKTYLA